MYYVATTNELNLVLQMRSDTVEQTSYYGYFQFNLGLNGFPSFTGDESCTDTSQCLDGFVCVNNQCQLNYSNYYIYY